MCGRGRHLQGKMYRMRIKINTYANLGITYREAISPKEMKNYVQK
jgi:hypothetical protein